MQINMTTINNGLVLKSINELLGEKFFIPAYQRGFRWTDQQVKDLLNDIWEFVNEPPEQEEGKEKPFYCLQPVVVKQYNKDQWEVIDGQQRLTTIFLILKNLENIIDGDKKNFKSIIFDTRKNSEQYLNNILEKDKDNNVDYYHIFNANLTINEWFKEKANNGYPNARVKFLSPFIENTKVIWYQVNDGSNAIDIFTRINIGKIPLTNSELIKALFLRTSNFRGYKADKGDKNNRIRLKQLQIASEWDKIENSLQDDQFWYFISNNTRKYATRIEYIFDLMKDKKDGNDQYFTFYKFNEEFESSKQGKKNPDIDGIWLKIKKYYLTFEEWYHARDLYHLIGFLISTGSSILYLKNNAESKTKTAFKDFLKEEISKIIACQINDLEYGNPMVKTILLLFNIQTILSNKKSNIRFPFDSFKKENWDIEHVRSQTDKTISGNSRRDWAADVLEFFTGKKEWEEQEKEIDLFEEPNKRIPFALLKIIDDEKIDDIEFESLYNEISIKFKEENEPENVVISNLTLLDAATNRSYKNAFFPIKRMTIIENDRNGTFVPICTKNVFLKSYSKKLDEVMYWNRNDADDYLSAIKETLSIYLPSQIEHDEQ
jgi:uncharacterized protein with ParB-like and HNH nuclease domain